MGGIGLGLGLGSTANSKLVAHICPALYGGRTNHHPLPIDLLGQTLGLYSMLGRIPLIVSPPPP